MKKKMIKDDNKLGYKKVSYDIDCNLLCCLLLLLLVILLRNLRIKYTLFKRSKAQSIKTTKSIDNNIFQIIENFDKITNFLLSAFFFKKEIICASLLSMHNDLLQNKL